MTEIFLRLFVKDYKNTGSVTVRRAYGTMASIVGVILNVILFTGKFLVGSLTGAISITADAFNNLSDAGSQIVSLVSFRISAKPADHDHPFGHARIEYVASMVVSFLILHVGFDLITDSVDKLIHPEEPDLGRWIVTVCVLGASVLGKLWLGLFNRSLGKRIDSSVMKATAVDSLSDALSTTAVLVGILLYMKFGWVWIDPAMGLIVAVLIMRGGLGIFNETKNSILGERPSDDIVEGIHGIVSEYPGALGIHDMVVHNYGPGRTIASLHVEVDGKKDIFELHEMIDDIEKHLSRELGIMAVIHMDPIVTDDARVTEMRNLTLKAVHAVDERLRIHDFRFVHGQAHSNLIFDIAAPFEVKMTDNELREAVSERLQAIDPRFAAVITIDRE